MQNALDDLFLGNMHSSLPAVLLVSHIYWLGVACWLGLTEARSKPDSKFVRRRLVAYVVCAATSLSAGLLLSYLADRTVVAPPLIVLLGTAVCFGLALRWRLVSEAVGFGGFWVVILASTTVAQGVVFVVIATMLVLIWGTARTGRPECQHGSESGTPTK